MLASWFNTALGAYQAHVVVPTKEAQAAGERHVLLS
jgi:hypothetical protein